MAPRLSERRKAVIFLVALAVAIAGLIVYVQASQPRPVPSMMIADAVLRVEGAAWTIHYAPAETTNNTVFGLLMEAASRLGFRVDYQQYTVPHGVLVTAINGTVSGQGPSPRYWQYWVNGVYGDVAADAFAIHSGDAILWNYTIPMEV